MSFWICLAAVWNYDGFLWWIQLVNTCLGHNWYLFAYCWMYWCLQVEWTVCYCVLWVSCRGFYLAQVVNPAIIIWFFGVSFCHDDVWLSVVLNDRIFFLWPLWFSLVMLLVWIDFVEVDKTLKREWYWRWLVLLDMRLSLVWSDSDILWSYVLCVGGPAYYCTILWLYAASIVCSGPLQCRWQYSMVEYVMSSLNGKVFFIGVNFFSFKMVLKWL